ncbi:2-polyprenyl-6-methoxyphenol hydroxylase [Variovorax sp. HW608]|uniref:FAD-dependent monooxygenase n=1 Tax=Variovorax sp. HW608 TaxID=1034889 RepID=UPI00081FEB51|nr:FAD-dependent monooxygenase [Variovorax sp. HW608]SCK15364.1 2-polyprenyl-6-methoxyphenol hydroxylase [Variovorax sp. HW608]
MLQVPVVIAGGGPVGLTLSLELARYGIESLVAERNPTTTKHPKMDITNGRSMELFRRIGIADKLRSVGVSASSPFTVTWITDFNSGHELHRFHYLSAEDEFWRRRTVNDGSLTLEAPLRISQIVVEPVLKQSAEACDMVDVRFGWRLESFVQDADGVTSALKNTATGENMSVRSKYLIGCDGGTSTVRTQLGIENDGTANVARLYMVHFRSKARDLLHRFGVAWHYQNGKGLIIAQDDKEYWTLHTFLPPGIDESQLDPRAMVEQWVGCKFDFEVLVANPWSAHYLVAQSYRNGRVMLAGDACHQFCPTGGYGMNTGIADAANLGWKLAAILKGWGGDTLLESYGVERQPIAKLSWATSESHLAVRMAMMQIYDQAGDLGGDSPEASAKRVAVGRQIADQGNAENEGWGTEHGYCYATSPIVASEPGAPPPLEPTVYVPTTRPGSRLPHVFLSDGTAVYDHLGEWFSLIVLNGSDTTAMEDAARGLGVPMKVVRIDAANVRAIYEADIVLVRPDQHVAWRGEKLPTDLGKLLSRVAGRQG